MGKIIENSPLSTFFSKISEAERFWNQVCKDRDFSVTFTEPYSAQLPRSKALQMCEVNPII